MLALTVADDPARWPRAPRRIRAILWDSGSAGWGLTWTLTAPGPPASPGDQHRTAASLRIPSLEALGTMRALNHSEAVGAHHRKEHGKAIFEDWARSHDWPASRQDSGDGPRGEISIWSVNWVVNVAGDHPVRLLLVALGRDEAFPARCFRRTRPVDTEARLDGKGNVRTTGR